MRNQRQPKMHHKTWVKNSFSLFLYFTPASLRNSHWPNQEDPKNISNWTDQHNMFSYLNISTSATDRVSFETFGTVENFAIKLEAQTEPNQIIFHQKLNISIFYFCNTIPFEFWETNGNQKCIWKCDCSTKLEFFTSASECLLRLSLRANGNLT